MNNKHVSLKKQKWEWKLFIYLLVQGLEPRALHVYAWPVSTTEPHLALFYFCFWTGSQCCPGCHLLPHFVVHTGLELAASVVGFE